jgi:hypothetical protein
MSVISEQDLIDTINGTESPNATPTPQEEQNPTAPIIEAEPPVKPEEQPTEQSVTPTFNLADELQKATNGEIKSAEHLAEILGKSKGLSELEAKLKTYEDENTSLKAKVAIDPYANDFTKKLDTLVRANVPQQTIDAFIRINKVENIDDLQPVEARILALQIKEGLTPQEAEDYINGTYKLQVEDEEDLKEVADVRREQIRLKVDANADKEFLKTHKAEVSSVPVDNSVKEAETRNQDLQKHVEAITPIVKNISNELSFKDFTINGKEGEAAIKMDLEFAPESKADIENRLMAIVKSDPLSYPNTQEGIDKLKSVGSTDKRVRAEYHNPTTPNRGNDNPNPGKTSNEELADWVLQNT